VRKQGEMRVVAGSEQAEKREEELRKAGANLEAQERKWEGLFKGTF